MGDLKRSIREFKKLFPRYDRYLVTRRFLKYVKIKGINACWDWKGQCSDRGYGMFGWPAKKIARAHIASYLLFVGSIPKRHGKKLCICHSCDNPSCVNPNHLWPGTNKQNTHDMMRKGRMSSTKGMVYNVGENNSHAKLTLEKVEEIRKKFSTGKYTKARLARKYSIHETTIYDIVIRRSWVN